MANSKKSALKAVPKFDPNKNYNWQSDSDFALKGAELEFLYKSFFSILNTETGRNILQANAALSILQSLIGKGLESGIVTEAPLPKPEEAQRTAL